MASGKYGTHVLVMGYCGLRWGEMAALRVQDLDLLRRRLTVAQKAVTVGGKVVVGTPKSHNHRSVPVPAFLVEQIAGHCEGKDRDDILFPAPLGGYLRPSNW